MATAGIVDAGTLLQAYVGLAAAVVAVMVTFGVGQLMVPAAAVVTPGGVLFKVTTADAVLVQPLEPLVIVTV